MINNIICNNICGYMYSGFAVDSNLGCCIVSYVLVTVTDIFVK